MRCVFALGGAVVLSLLAPESLEAWSAGFMGVLNHHGKLAERAERCQRECALEKDSNCIALPRPPRSRCDQEVDDDVLFRALRLGSSEPDRSVGAGGDGTNSSKHSHNSGYGPEWDSSIREALNLSDGSKITPGSALKAIESEEKEVRNKLGELRCNSSMKDYEKIWKRFGRLSHYPADLASPLHAYSVGIDGVYHEGDRDAQERWYRGLWDIGGRAMHGLLEVEMGRAVEFESLECVPLLRETVAENARAVMKEYRALTTPMSGYEGLVKDYTNGQFANHYFFAMIAPQQALDALGGILYSWQKVLKDFQPPPNCRKLPPVGCGDCGGGECRPPGGDHPDELEGVPGSWGLPGSTELLNQAWDRLAVKKDKKSLIWFWIQDYLLGEYRNGAIEEETYLSLSAGYELTSEVAWELFHEDYVKTPDLSILGLGFALSMSDLLQRELHEPIRRYKPNDFSPDALIDYSVLIIPSGGLLGFENSSFFRANLEEYVRLGGTLIVFAQQHGYEFSALPVPEEADGSRRRVSGYGWAEDHSCFRNAAFIDTWHQILAGLSKATPDLNVDGYFTEYPSNSTILLRRTANGQPAMLMYEYGLGRVIVTSMYSDFASQQNQASSEEKALVRDMITWAKRPETLPQVRPGQAANIELTVVNHTSRDSSSVKLFIRTPDRASVLEERTLEVMVPAGQRAAIQVSFPTSPNGPVGIYHVDYLLLDPQGLIVQPEAETDSGRFVVSNPPPDPYRSPDFSFSVQSDSEHYLPGSSVRFTFNLWNNTETDRQINTRFLLLHNGRREEQVSTVPARGHTSFTYVLEPVRNTDRVWAYFRDENGRNVGFAAKGIWVVQPEAALKLEVDKARYEKGDSVLMTGSMDNKVVLGWPAEARIAVSNAQRELIFEDSRSLFVPGSGSATLTGNFTIPETARPGTYYVSLEAWYGGKRVSASSTKFDLPESRVMVRPDLPPVYNSGINTIFFRITNQGQVNVRRGTLEITLTEPGGNLVWSESLGFALGVGESKSIPVGVVFPPLKLGTYFLSYAQSDETKTGSPTVLRITNNTIPVMSAFLDKSTYNARDTALLTVSLLNNGQFALEDVPVVMSLLGTSQSETRYISLPPGESSQLAFSVSIPPAIPPGRQNLEVKAFLSPQAVLRREVSFNLPASRILVTYSGPPTLAAGEIARLTIQNAGGVDTAYVAESISLTSAEGRTIWEGNGAGQILSGESKNLAEIPIPHQTARGPVTIRARVRNQSNQELVLLTKSLLVEGLAASLETITTQDVYLLNDFATGLTTVSNGALGLENGTITVSVSRVAPTSILGFRVHYPRSSYNRWTTRPQAVAVAGDGRLFVPEGEKDRLWEGFPYGQTEWSDIWNGFSDPSGIAISAEGSVYVADAGGRRVLRYDGQPWAEEFGGGFNFVEPSGVALGSDGQVFILDAGLNQVLKFDSQGNLVGQWGEPGQAEGQMLNPRAIAVSREGRILVADTGNHRIQIFDDQGNHVLSLGGQGIEEGRFFSPQGVAIGPEDSIYVADTGNNRIQVFDREGNFLIAWGEQGRAEGQFSSPRGLAVGPDGTVYVADTLNSRIQAFEQSGNYLFSWAIGYCEPTCGACEEVYPGHCDYLTGYCREKELFYCQEEDYWSIWFQWGTAMAASREGTLYAFNPYRSVIQELDLSSGQLWVVREWGAGDGQFQDPKGMAVGPDSTIYVLDTGNNRVQRFNKEGFFLGGWGTEGDGQGQFRSPEGIAVCWDGKVFVADTGNNRIQVFNSEGSFVADWGREGQSPGEFFSPRGIAIGPVGYVYVADTGNNRIQRFDLEGRFLGEFGTPASGSGQLNSPTGIAVGALGSVYVVDSGNNRVVHFDMDGNFLDEWAEYECNYGDVDYCRQNFQELNSISLGPEETIYLADSERFYISLNQDEGVERIFETKHAASLSPGETRQFTDLTGPLTKPGKYLLEATAQNSLSQVLARASHPFYAVEHGLVLSFSSEKKLYRPGELIRILGRIENRTPVAVSGLTLYLFAQNSAGEKLELISQTMELPAGASLPISASMVAGQEERLLLTGLIIRRNMTLVEAWDRLEIEEPRVYQSLDLPQVVGKEPFPIRVHLTNPGRLPASVGLEIREEGGEIILAQEINLQGGEKRSLETLYQIQRDTDFKFLFTRDLSLEETREVLYGLGAQILLTPQPVYPEGPVAVEVSLSNTGQLDETLIVSYQVSPTGIQTLRSYNLAAGETAKDTLYFILPEGSYGIVASCLQPNASAQAFFNVKKQNRVGVTLSVFPAGAGFVPVTAQVSNLGANEVGFSVLAEVTSESGGPAWSGQQTLAALTAGSSESFDFQIPTAFLSSGSHLARVSVLSSSGEALASAQADFTVKAPLIHVIHTPPYQAFQPGQEAVFSFRLRNSGDQGSNFTLKFKAQDLADYSEQAWLGAGEEKEVVFGALLPGDLDERDYFGTWELVSPGLSEKGTVRYRVAGLNLKVAPSLDKPSYREGETARLTLLMQSTAASELPLVAQVKYSLFEENRPFTLAGSQSLVFDIPLPSITGEKLFLGIYRESGRSVYLNSLYIHKAAKLLNLTTDKQLYAPGDTVVVTVEGEAAGNMSLTGPGGYKESLAFSGFASRSFVLPLLMTAGAYEVSAQLQTPDSQPIFVSRTFDVAGIQVRVKEASLDKARYNSTDNINLSLQVESSEPLAALIRTWVVDPQGEYTELTEVPLSLANEEPVLAGLSVPFSTNMLGLHRLAYGIYLGDLLLCSGAEAFDVGKALLLGVRTDKADYKSNTEPVQIEAKFLGEGEGTLEVLVDDIPQGVLPVTLQGGSGSLGFTLPSISAGAHTVKAVLRVEGLTSLKETSFVYGSGLPDLSVELTGSLEAGNPPQASFSIEIRNQGQGNSPATTLALYEEAAAQLLGSFEVSPLAQGQTQSFSHTTQLTGAPGPRTFLAKVDPQAQVVEFQEENNQASLTLAVPELWLETSTDKEIYHPGETVHISSRIWNHGTLPLQGLSLETVTRDQAGAVVFFQTTGFDLAAASELTLEVQWPIPSGLSRGTYFLEQQVVGKSLVSKRTLTLAQQEMGFTLWADASFRKAEAGEPVSWVLSLQPVSEFEGEVSLSVTGTPPNSALVLLPNPVSLSGGLGAQAVLKVITTPQSPTGTYSLNVTAFSAGSQSSIQVGLEIVDFSVSITPTEESVRQLEKAVFKIRTAPLGSFDGPVSFSLSELPKGVRAELSATGTPPGEEVALEILASKWASLGNYTFEVTARGRAVSHSVQGRLAIEANPILSPSILTSCFRDHRGRSIMKSFTPEGNWLRDYLASPKGGAVSLASGDLDGDGLDEIVVGTTRGGIFSPAKIRVLARDGKVLAEVATEHRGWLHPPSLAVWDLDGDWKEEVIVGLSSQEEPQEETQGEQCWPPGAGQGVVKVYKFVGGRLVDTGLRFTPFSEQWAWRAPNVAIGDINGDGNPELITAPGPTPMAPALVRIFRIETQGEPHEWEVGPLTAEWEVSFGPSRGTWVGYGANVSAADVDCDGRDEIILGAPPSPRARGEVVVLKPEAGDEEHVFLAFSEGRGVYVASKDLDGDGCAEVVAGQGAGPKVEAKVRVFKGDGSLVREFQAGCQPPQLGVRVGVGALGD